MEIVIKLPDNIMEYIRNNGCLSVIYSDEVAKAIINGTPLPKGHGRLIDIDNDLYDLDRRRVEYAPKIIEADKEAENETDN